MPNNLIVLNDQSDEDGGITIEIERNSRIGIKYFDFEVEIIATIYMT